MLRVQNLLWVGEVRRGEPGQRTGSSLISLNSANIEVTTPAPAISDRIRGFKLCQHFMAPEAGFNRTLGRPFLPSTQPKNSMKSTMTDTVVNLRPYCLLSLQAFLQVLEKRGKKY